MPDQPKDAASQRNQSINWLVGLSGGALGGALLKFDWLLKLPTNAKHYFLVAAGLFLLSILTGVYYAFQTLAVSRFQTEVERAKALWPPDQNTEDRAVARLERAEKKQRVYHLLTMAAFGVAGICSLVMMAKAIQGPPLDAKEPTPPPNKFELKDSLVYNHGRLSHSHTFLLNQQSGDVWEMICQSGNVVEFRHVQRTGHDGRPEAEPMSPALSGTSKQAH